MEIINDSQWISGLDSISYTLAQGSYAWGQNVVNRGGIIETRQGLAEIASVSKRDPRGLGFVTVGGITYLLAAIGNYIYKLNLNNPATGLVKIDGLFFKVYDEPDPPTNPVPAIPTAKRMVHFELCVQAQKTEKTGASSYKTTQITPKFVVIIQDGFAPPQYWDPQHAANQPEAGNVDEHPDFVETKPNNTPRGTFMKWAGDRLWVIQGRKLRASNLLNPFQFTEEVVTASGGFFYLPDNVTGMGITHDYKQLLVFTHFTTSAFQVGLELRSAWPDTQDFQRVVFPSIGCASHRTIINMYGMTWWMSHDGIVGLDNAMATNQTTKLDIKDLNMIRSKANVSWGQGGGASGSFGNFLFFSVPSASKWNQHTWVLDQTPISLLMGSSAPSWCANWTGIRPEQWVTCQVGGQQRCFCISRDLTEEGHQSTIWEAFIGQRMDVPKVGDDRKARDIGCAFESRFIGLSPSQYMKLRWIELDVAEIVGDVALQVYYCGRRTSYKKIIDTHLTAKVSVGTEEVFNPDDPIPVNVPQYRTIRSVTDTHSTTDNNPEVQTPYLRYKDREFSVLVQWSGQMAVSGLRLAVDPEPDYMEGTDFPDEYLQRTITAEGSGGIGCTFPPANAPTGQLTSKFLSPTKPRWVEFPAYDSAVPNGVFFVDELFALPTPAPYPENTYPLDVTFSSETQGIQIYYTLDNTQPRPPPNTHGELYGPGNLPHITMTHVRNHKPLRAVGFREGLRNSVPFIGVYTQSQVESVVFSPPAGSYPIEDFPQPVPDYNGPVAMYNLNEGTGTKAGDSSPNDLSGVVHNTTWNATGKHGKALNFNGTNGYVSIEAKQPLRFQGSMTLSAWVNVSALPPFGQTNFIVGRANGLAGWSIYTDFTNHAVVSVAKPGPPQPVFATRASSTLITLNTWTHITGVYNATAGTLDMYINGVLSNGTLTGTVPLHTQALQGVAVALGRRADGTCFFHGILDDVRIYDRVATSQEITHDMNTGVTPPPPPGVGFAVRLTSATAGTNIHYRVNNVGGNVPPITIQDTLYDPAEPPHPAAGNVIHAKAFKQYYLPSDQTNAHYVVKPRCATPVCHPVGGEYPVAEFPKDVRIQSATSGCQLRYTIDDPDVTTNGIVKPNNSTISVGVDTTLRVIAQKADLSDSLVKTETYAHLQNQVATPLLDPPVVFHSSPSHRVDVNITCQTEGVTMYWICVDHSDQSLPSNTNGTQIVGSEANIILGPDGPNRIGHKTLKVIAYKEDMHDSEIATGTYDFD